MPTCLLTSILAQGQKRPYKSYSSSDKDLGFAHTGVDFLLNGLMSIFAAYYFRKYGFLAPVGIHFWADIVWHVLWGLI